MFKTRPIPGASLEKPEPDLERGSETGDVEDEGNPVEIPLEMVVPEPDLETRLKSLKTRMKSAANSGKIFDCLLAAEMLEALISEVGPAAFRQEVVDRWPEGVLERYLSEVGSMAMRPIDEEKANALQNIVPVIIALDHDGWTTVSSSLEDIATTLTKSLSFGLHNGVSNTSLKVLAQLAEHGVTPYGPDELKALLEMYLHSDAAAPGYYALTGAIIMNSDDESLREAAVHKERKRVKVALKSLNESDSSSVSSALELISLFGNGRTYLLEPVIQLANSLSEAINAAPQEAHAEKMVFGHLVEACAEVATHAAEIILNPSENDPEGAIEAASGAASMLRALSGIGVRAKMIYGCFDPQDAECQADSIADMADAFASHDAPASFEFLGDNATEVLRSLKSRGNLAEIEEKGVVSLSMRVDMDNREGESFEGLVGRAKATLLALNSLEAKVNVQFAGENAELVLSHLELESFLIQRG